MYLAEQEMRSQFGALTKTTAHILGQRATLQPTLDAMGSLLVLGCGSSYSTAKSSALQFSQKTDIAAWAVAAGDLLVNFADYQTMLKGATLLLLSRSGSTSELLLAVERCREKYPNIQVISVCAVENAPVSNVADVNLEIPWAFDQSVCQTRTVSNLYTSALLLAAMKAGDENLIAEIQAIEEKSTAFCREVEGTLDVLAVRPWHSAVVLADSGMAGLAEEGALAFKEICRTPSNFYHVLDVRHGPVVTIDKQTLVVVLVSSGDERLQVELIEDVQKHAGCVLVLKCQELTDPITGMEQILLPPSTNDNAAAVFMLYCIQLLCLKKALDKGLNPDEPEGLDSWIKLDEDTN